MFRNYQWGNVDEMWVRRILMVAKHFCIPGNNPKWPFKTVDFYISFQLYYILFLWQYTVSKSMDSSSVTSLIFTGQLSLEAGIYLCHFLHLYLTLQLSFRYYLCLLAVGLLRPVLQISGLLTLESRCSASENRGAVRLETERSPYSPCMGFSSEKSPVSSQRAWYSV